MPRLLRHAAVLGTTAYMASKHGAATAQGTQHQEAPRPPVLEQQPASAAEAAAPPAPPEDRYGDLMKLKELLDAGVLTRAEFETEKQTILGS